MADKINKHPEGAAGPFYVDTQCIDCDLCRQSAPKNFQRQEDRGYSYVFKQPETPEETAQCVEGMFESPVAEKGQTRG